jgi:hypothetical protein
VLLRAALTTVLTSAGLDENSSPKVIYFVGRLTVLKHPR